VAIMSPAWENHTALPFATQTASFDLTVPMCGLVVPYSSASAGTVTISAGLTPVVGAVVFLGQASTGALTVVGTSGVTVGGVLTTPGLNSVLRAIQTAKDVWEVSMYSWSFPTMSGNANGQGSFVSYQSITLTNTGSVAVQLSTDPNMVWGGAEGSLLNASSSGVAGGSMTVYYGNSQAKLWYGCCATGTFSLSVTTGAGGGFAL